MSYIFNKPSSPTPPPNPSGVVITYLDTVGAGTHTLNENTQMVELYLFGAGQGGQGGQANFSYGSDGNGGTAGLPGSVVHRSIPVDFFGGAGSNVSYFIGSGGSGSAGVIAFLSPSLGDVGEDTSFGYLVAAGGGSALQASFQNNDNVNFLNPSVVDSISIIPARSSAGASVTSSTSGASLDGGSVLAGNATVLYAGGAGNPSVTVGSSTFIGAAGNAGEDGFDTYFSAGSGSSGGGAGSLAKGGQGAIGSWPSGGGSGGGASYVESMDVTGGDGGSGADGLIIVIEWLG